MIFERIFNDDDFDRVNNMVRWNGWRRLNDETVGHHSFLVTWFSRLLAEELWSDSDKDSLKLEIATYAIFHDFDEMITGDVLHGLKYNGMNGAKIRKLIDDYVETMVLSKFYDDNPSTKLMREYMIGDVTPIVKNVVKLADWISMSYYVKREIDMGNSDMSKPLIYCNRAMGEQARKTMDLLEEGDDSSILNEIIQWVERI